MFISNITCLFLALTIIASSKISQLSVSNIDNFLYFVQVYQEKCVNCNSEQKQLQDISKLFEGIIKVGKVNIKNIPVMKDKKLQKNPSYFLVKGSISNIVQYKQKISRALVSKFIVSQIGKTVKTRESEMFPNSNANSNNQEDKKARKNAKDNRSQKDASGVTILTDNDFQSNVMQSSQAWFIQFYSPSCGHCVALQPEWDKLPSKIGKRVRIAKIDATVNRKMAQKYGIKGFPTLLFFSTQDKKTPIPYQGQRTSEAMISWLLTQKIAQEKLQFIKLSKQLYDKQCNRNIVCLIFIMQKKNELKELQFIKQLLQEHKGKPLRFFYSGRVMKLQTLLMIEDRSTPKLVSIWDSLESYKIYNGQINKNDVNQYISKIMDRKSWIKSQSKLSSLLFSDANQQL